MHKAFEVEEKVLLGGWWSAVQREEINVMCRGKSSFVVLCAKNGTLAFNNFNELFMY